MGDAIVISLNGLRSGKSDFSRHLGREFFSSFGNSDILDADISAQIRLEKAGDFVGLDIVLEGTLTVQCDRCLADLVLPVGRTVLLSVKFGPEPTEDAALEENGREVLYLPEDGLELDISQVVYDWLCLSIPIQHVHAPGECDPEVVKYLARDSECTEESSGDSPFAALKGLFDEK